MRSRRPLTLCSAVRSPAVRLYRSSILGLRGSPSLANFPLGTRVPARPPMRYASSSQYSIGEGLRDLPNENDSKRTDKLNRYTGPTTQDLLEQLRSVQVDADVAPNLQNGSVASLGKRIEDIIDSLERFFNVHPSQLRPQMPPRSTGHIMGDTTQLVAAAAPLLRIIHANGLRGGDVLINRVLDVLTASTIVATDRKGLKFSTSQIAKFLSTFRFLNPSSNPSARRLLRVLAARLSRSSASERKWKARGTVDKMTSPELGYAMLGFSSASNFNADMKILARVVTRHVWNMDSAVSARDMSRALYGLQGFSDNCVETHDLLCALNRAFRLENPQFAGGPSVASDSFRDCSTSQGTIDRQMTTRELSSGVYGLKQLSDEDPAVQELLKILSDQLDGLINSSSETTFTARETAMIMQGVRSMMFQSDSARRFIGRLSVVLGRAPAVDNEVYALSGLNLANAINGMKNMSSGIVEVCQLITVLQRRIPQATSLTTVNIPTIRDITAAYFGLRNMHSDSAEVKCLLAALNRSYLNLEHLDLSIDTRCMGNILYGLRFMQDDEPEVRKLLLWLTRQMKARIVEGGTFSENRPLAYAFHGLRNMSCNFQEVRDLLDLLNGQLEHHLLSARPPMQTWEVVLAFNGLQYKSATLDGEESLLQRTCIILAEALARSEKLERLSPSYICSIMASLNVLSSEYSEVNFILQPLVSSMQEHVRCGLSNKSHLRPVYFQISDTAKLDQSNDSSEPCILPSHQLIADAIQGLHLLSRSRTTVELVDLFTSFLLINSPVYSSQNASTHAVRGKGRYIDNYIDGSRQISQNRFTKDQVLQMMSGLQCMHTEVPDLDDTGAMSRAVDRMFSYLIEQLYLSQDLDMRDYSENSIKHEQSSTNMPMPKDLHLSPHQLAKLVLCIRGLNCSDGLNSQFNKMSLMNFINKALNEIAYSCPSGEIAVRDYISSKMEMRIDAYTIYRRLFQRCILSFPYVDNVPESLKTEIFGSVAVLNEKLDEIQRHFSEHNLNLVRSENKEFCTWKSNWVSLAQTWFDRKLEIGEISQKCFSILIETDQSLHYFDTDIVLKIKLVHSDGGCTIETERVVNIEIEQIRDYLNTEKARFDQMRDLFLSKYHDVVIIRGSMRNVNVDIHDIENDLVFTAAKEALHDIVQ